MNTPTPIKTCRDCGGPMAGNAPEGLCARCLLSVALKEPDAPNVAEAGSPADPPPSPDSSDLPDIGDAAEVARRLPQFEILELLGRGGMGVVYKARQLNLDRIVALKILPPADALSPDFVERFRREARSLAKLTHPNIVNVHDSGESGGLCYFVMEFVDGVNLREMIRTGKMKPEEALAVVPKICDALQFAHEEGVVHRDIKPENILIDKRGWVKIADFGLAKLLRREQTDYTLTQSGMTLGTPRYMAPEQLDKPETVDHRADIYSLGVVFYEMLTGEVPMGRFAPPSQKVRIDVRLDEIVLHALERDAERRYQHASELKTEVESVSNDPVSAGSPPAPAAKPWSAWVWWTVLVLAALPFLQIAELNRAAVIAGHHPNVSLAGLAALALLALGAFAVIRLVELLRPNAGATPASPFSQAWLGIIAALFGVCIISVGQFPHVEWLHVTLTVNEVATADKSVKLAGFSQTFVQYGFEFWQGKAAAAVSFLAGAFLLLAPRRLRWNMACSVMLVLAGVALVAVAREFELHRPEDSFMTAQAVDERAKIDPRILQFRDDLRRHLTAEAEQKKLPEAFRESALNSYGAAFTECQPANGVAVCGWAALALILAGVLKLRQTMQTSPAAFAGLFRAADTWSGLLFLVPCLIAVLSAGVFGWMESAAWISLLHGEPWMGDWVKSSRQTLPGIEFRDGRIVAAAAIAAILAVLATALLRWKRGARAVALSLAGAIITACPVHFLNESRHEKAMISWDDFQAVAQRGPAAGGAAQTRQVLGEHPQYAGLLMELEKNVQALAAKLTIPDPAEIPQQTITKSADGKTTSATATVPMTFFNAFRSLRQLPPTPSATTTLPMNFFTTLRKEQAQKLAEGGGVVNLSSSPQQAALLAGLFGLGVFLLGIRDGCLWWRERRERRSPVF